MTTIQDLPKGWATASLGEVATYQNGRAFKPSEWGVTGIPIIRIQNLNNASADFNFSNKPHEEKFRVRNGDLLYAWSASLGAYIWKGEDAWLNQHIFRVDHTKMIDRLFFYYTLTNITAMLYDKAHGSGMVHVTKGRFEETSLRLPPLSEQHRIVAKLEELLSELDKGIEAFKTAREQLTVYRQAVLKHAFEGKLTEEWRKKHADELEPAEILLEKIKAEREQRYRQQLKDWNRAVKAWEAGGKEGKKPTKPVKPKELPPLTQEVLAELPELPDGWKWCRAGWLFESVTSGSRGWAKHYSDKGAVFIRITNLDFDSLKLDLSKDKIQHVDPPNNAEGLRTRVQEGDFLFSITGYLGMFAIAPNLYEAYVNQHIALARPLSGFSKEYFGYYVTAKTGGHHHLSRLTKGAVKAGLGLDDIQSFPVPMCSQEEQKKIVSEIESRLSVAEKLEQEIEDGLKQAEVLRQSLLKKAFEGRLVPQDPNDEPTSVLLERVRAEREAKAQAAKKTKKKSGKRTSRKKPKDQQGILSL